MRERVIDRRRTVQNHERCAENNCADYLDRLAATCSCDDENRKRNQTRQKAQSMRDAVCNRFTKMVKRFCLLSRYRMSVDIPVAL